MENIICYKSDTGECIGELPVVGSYGTFNLPIVEFNGMECVAESRYYGDDGKPEDTYCQSRGCDYCSMHGSPCCRDGELSHRDTRYFI